jgi:hypothetical protein
MVDENENIQDSEATTDEALAPPTPPAELPEEPPPAPAEKHPFVKFIGTRIVHGETERLTEAPDWLRSGEHIFDDLPDSETQLKGFNYERAAELCRAFPGLYKKEQEIKEEA